MASLEPGNILRVTRVEIAAAKLKMALDKSMGVESEPAVVAIANARRRPLTPSKPASTESSAELKDQAS